MWRIYKDFNKQLHCTELPVDNNRSHNKTLPLEHVLQNKAHGNSASITSQLEIAS